ncbi:pentapeptide repeat-containing protein [Kiloniella majae]|uniref:pentapeptide repeat-containing protein n=1 Tax=Kiloniella majae TaxID=1938558 RepID=UPI000A278064|nr:pentapeptide repeat-containing protein [Kiloniella majae]
MRSFKVKTIIPSIFSKTKDFIQLASVVAGIAFIGAQVYLSRETIELSTHNNDIQNLNAEINLDNNLNTSIQTGLTYLSDPSTTQRAAGIFFLISMMERVEEIKKTKDIVYSEDSLIKLMSSKMSEIYNTKRICPSEISCKEIPPQYDLHELLNFISKKSKKYFKNNNKINSYIVFSNFTLQNYNHNNFYTYNTSITDSLIQNTNVQNFYLKQSKLTSNTFIESNINFLTHPNTSFEKTLFVDTNLNGSSFDTATLRQVKFIRGSCNSCDFSQSDLRNAIFDGIQLDNASFSNTVLEGACFTNIPNSEDLFEISTQYFKDSC